MIPKQIFYIWLGGKKNILANICIENWRIMLTDYEIIEINEKTPEWFNFDYEYNNNLWFKTVYDLKMWAYASDYIRFSVLYEHGGLYLDTDITVYQNFNPLLNNQMFIGNMINNIPEMAVIGVIKHHPIMKLLRNFYQEKIWSNPEYITCNIFKKIIYDEFNIIPNDTQIVKTDILTIYPHTYFYPTHYIKNFDFNEIKKETYTVHWENGSWATKKNLFFLTNKHRIPLKTLLKQIKFIEEHDKNANQKINILQEA